MFCHEDHILRLAALAIQAERGNTTSLGRIEDYVPAQVTTYHYVLNILAQTLGNRCWRSLGGNLWKIFCP